MSIITTIIESLAPRIINGVDKKALSKIKMKLCGRIKTHNLSPTACELIVAVLEKDGAILEKHEGLYITLGDRDELFVSGIPEKERLPLESAMGELVDNGLVSKFTDKLYTATKKAWKNQKRLIRQDDVRVFLYAPKTLKSFYQVMARGEATVRIPFWDHDKAIIEVRCGEHNFKSLTVPPQIAEQVIEYLWRGGLLDEMWFTHKNGGRLFGLTINGRLDLDAINNTWGSAFPLCICGSISKRGQRVARIKLNKLNEYIKSEE